VSTAETTLLPALDSSEENIAAEARPTNQLTPRCQSRNTAKMPDGQDALTNGTLLDNLE
jgi:hypothetical protein